MKKILSLSLIAFTVILSSCEKDPAQVSVTAGINTPPIVVSPVAPPTIATDSTLLLGNPSSATSNTADFSNYLLREGYYSVSYNRDAGRPNWVSWHTQSTDYGSVPRQNDFRANQELPSDWYRAESFSFGNVYEFDKGHMCPSADRTSSIVANSSTFLMTNIIAQAPNNNQQRWAMLEDYCRTLVQAGNELYIICGTYGEGGKGNSNTLTNTLDNGRISVPAKLWKIIVVLEDGANDLTRVKNTTRVISVIMDNVNTTGTDWKSYRVSVDEIEGQTGYDFLSRVSPTIQSVVEARVDNM
jgi:endonuclease G